MRKLKRISYNCRVFLQGCELGPELFPSNTKQMKWFMYQLQIQERV